MFQVWVADSDEVYFSAKGRGGVVGWLYASFEWFSDRVHCKNQVNSSELGGELESRQGAFEYEYESGIRYCQ